MMDLKTMLDTQPWDWPEDAGKFFLGFLLDGQAEESDRLLAVGLAGDYTVINDELAEALLSIVQSGNETEVLRGMAAIALGPALEHADLYEFEDPDDILISEEVFLRIQESLRKLFMDADVPKEAQRRILEVSVRAPQDWHPEAVRTAYSSGDEDWKLTAVFCMQYIRGFNDQILEALNSKNPDIRYHAVGAAGNWEVAGAWPHIAALLTAPETDKPLLLAAIDAVAGIRPMEAPEILGRHTNSDDEDIAEAAFEALAMAGWVEDDDDDWEDDEILH